MDQVQSASAVARAVEAERVSHLGVTGARARGEVPFSLQGSQAQAIGRVPEATPCLDTSRSRDVHPGGEGTAGKRDFAPGVKTRGGRNRPAGKRGLLLDERR